ncbi:TonB family protein [Pseudoxanthomonas sp. PXM01]|uniref:TonB family protein n=1 Tax=Pseudoxanthomonas sp. PXM01 TaxID=2769295 RepID=UPI001786AE18|nr:TonB family protein [Pseudoxanthomonas sp. PXM01]MBD9470607.1 TonB family protein [Pseudoxanthomonas sp. PXM01]
MGQRNTWVMWLLVLALAWAPGAGAQNAGAVRKQAEASMRVTGSISIAVDGSVESVELDTPEKLPDGIPAFVGRNVATWRFEPVMVDGQPRRALTRMSALLVGRSLGDGQMEISIRGADFGDYEAMPEAERVSAKQMRPPGYPMAAAQGGVQGTAYLLLKIERDGTVGDVIAEQVNLRIVANESQMNQHRDRFARAAMAAARKWTFAPPTVGAQATQPYWVVRVPVDFNFGEARRYGKWAVYIPGPRMSPAWAPADEAPGFSPEALADGGVHLAGNTRGPKLLTPLDGA